MRLRVSYTRVGDFAQSHICLGPFYLVSQPFQDGSHDLLVAMFVAACSNAQGYDGIYLLLDLMDQTNDFFRPFHADLNLYDGRHHFLVENILAQCSRGHIGHEQSKRVLLLKPDAGLGQRPSHLLNVA